MNAHALSILVADDDPMSLGPMREALLGAGYAVEFVEDVDAALETLGATRAPILIADWLLPGGGGAELCRAIRRDPELAATHVILVTGCSGKDNLVAGLDAGADDYLT
ncbi:MAG: response regulator, partial [Phycisphaerales bacterium]|nr:response regulator [Phycisphaerales bacterium]